MTYLDCVGIIVLVIIGLVLITMSGKHKPIGYDAKNKKFY
jgi:hypothetical protein